MQGLLNPPEMQALINSPFEGVLRGADNWRVLPEVRN